MVPSIAWVCRPRCNGGHSWGRVGIALKGDSYRTSKQGEILYSIFTQESSGFGLAAGGGVLHEAGGVDVLLARIASGREFDKWRLHGNVVLQKPFSAGRDAMDAIISAGWARRLGSAVSLGVEGIGEDLEGFWDPAEAEGGARLMIGPSLHLAPVFQGFHMLFQCKACGPATDHGSAPTRAGKAKPLAHHRHSLPLHGARSQCDGAEGHRHSRRRRNAERQRPCQRAHQRASSRSAARSIFRS